ncbi:MAG TPA: ATP-binding cassette domain-containing protein, partial [Rhabdochlamydiaceae bacterium]|nr:ATP-binding cassette domain-containing protein [Rhabdochlamydiaceae bacterium]
MTLLLNCQALSKSFGPRTLFEGLCFSIFTQQRVGLIGPNGAGKSTLLKMLAGYEKPTEGIISSKRGLKIGYVPQSCEFPDISPEAVLHDTLKDDQRPDYEKDVLVQTLLSKLGFKGNETSAHRLSGGWKKRLSIAKAVILAPDLLLLDEPTNHLDLEGIFWLEK